MDTLTSFLIGVASSLTAVWILRYRVLFKYLPSSSTKGYLIELEQKIRQMPFIYKDLEIDVINDFVDIELQNINLGTLRLQATSKAIDIKDDEKLRRTLRMLFLGNAGIGKTTFQRRTILSLINNKRDFIYTKERPLPVYLPLKAIDNSKPFPIRRYILNNNPLFTHRFGQSRLLKLSKKSRLFLFLDGYDEIPFTGDTDNFVQTELSLILFPETVARKKSLDDEVREFYQSLSGCRVWLSSRLEFFEKNPIGALGSGENIKVGRVAAVELKGIGNNRMQLAGKIFDKYRQRSTAFYEFLDEEFFLHEIDSSNDTEIKSLSYNPLFLTVMCYIYAQKAIEEKSHKVLWANKFEDLIIECLDLLIKDLDEIKARDLSRAQRAGLQTRRNLYSEEKKLFLQYFALQLFFDNKSIFNLDYLKTKISAFFTNEHQISNSGIILDGLNEDNPSKPNFALQLIYQGVFVLVDKSRNETSYDFPQRRFREVLASRYITTPERYEQLLANIEKKQFTELLGVFFSSTGFKNAVFQEESLAHILEGSKWQIETDYYVRVTRYFMRHKPHDYNVNRVVRRFILECLASRVYFRISEAVFNEYKPDMQIMNNLPATFRDALEKSDANRLSLCCFLLRTYNRTLLIELLSAAVTPHLHNRVLLPVLFQFVLKTKCEAFGDLNDDEAFLDFCYAFAHHLSTSGNLPPNVTGPILDRLTSLSRERLLVLFYFIQKYSPFLFWDMKSLLELDVDPELFVHAEEAKLTNDSTVNSPPSDAYLITEKSLTQVKRMLTKKSATIVFELGVPSERSRMKWSRARLELSHKLTEALVMTFSSNLNRLYEQTELKRTVRKLINEVVVRLATNSPPDAPVFREVRSVKGAGVTEQSLESIITDITDLLMRVSLINERYIVSSSAANEINAFLDRRKVAVVVEKVLQPPPGPMQTLYAAVEPSTLFKEQIIHGLERLRGNLYTPEVFNQQIEPIVLIAITDLKSENFKFVSPQNLPPEVRAEEARNADRYKWKGFERDVLTGIKRICLVDGNIVQQVQTVVNGISYIPRPLIEFVE